MSAHLVTGATGYVGQALVRQLLEQGETVGVVIRGDDVSARMRFVERFPGYESRYPGRFLMFNGDVTLPGLGISPPVSELSNRGEVTVWHLAANLSFEDADSAAVMETNVGGTRNVVELVNRHNFRLYHVSTAYVAGDAGGQFGEDDLDVGQGFHNSYERSKFLAEQVVRGECVAPYTILRPSIIVGGHEAGTPNCTFGYYRLAFMFYFVKRRLTQAVESGPVALRWLLRALGTRYDPAADVLHAPWLLMPYPRGSGVDLVHIQDVVAALLAAHRQPLPSGSTIHITQQTPPTFRFLLSSFLADTGLEDVKLIGLPAPHYRAVFRAVARVMGPYRSYLRSTLKYLPYITANQPFALDHANSCPAFAPSPISRSTLAKINRHAVDKVFVGISWELHRRNHRSSKGSPSDSRSAHSRLPLVPTEAATGQSSNS